MYAWALYETQLQVNITPAEAAAAVANPLLSRAGFNLSDFASSHGMPASPVALTWALEVVDPYVAYTWAVANELQWLPLATREALVKAGYLATTCKSIGGGSRSQL